MAFIWLFFRRSGRIPQSEGEFNVRNGKRIVIIVGSDATGLESRAAEILESRIEKRSNVEVRIEPHTKAEDAIGWADVVFSVGNNYISSKLMEDYGAQLPTLPNSNKQHPEGFLVRSGVNEGKPAIVIVGVDDRGTIYGVGYVLREIGYYPDHIELPSFDVREKPAFWLRGSEATGPGSSARKFGDIRPQTEEERREILEDLLLLGVNIMRDDPDVLRLYGMMVSTTAERRAANEMLGGPDGSRRVKDEWAADEGVNNKLACPSIPEARKALLKSFEKVFSKGVHHDVFFIKSGDPGGCHCPKCRPWGKTYMELVREIAEILHRYDPDCKVIATNQDLTNEDNQALFDYLNDHDSTWLYAISYGPGSDEMQTRGFFRGPVNPRWFEYEGFGRLGNFVKHMHHQLPRDTHISLFSDITHWMQAQYGIKKPDPALSAVFGRRTWNARPKRLHRISRETFRYAVGEMPYSEGMHDDFNKWFWARLLWDPDQSAEEITREYCRYWFGDDAQDEMTEVIMLMEQTLENAVRGNTGISKAVELIRSAREKIPQNLMEHDWRYRIIAQKALIDRYIQLELERGDELKSKARALIEDALKSDDPRSRIEEALEILESTRITSRMREIREEALAIGEESNQIIGYRVPACFTVVNWDLTEIDWWIKTLKEGLSTGNQEEMVNSINMVLEYENPGKGGRHDQLGWFDRPETLECKGLRWMLYPFQGPARLSHFGLAYPDPVKSDRITLVYDGLEKDVQYRLRALARVHTKGCRPHEEKDEAEASIRINGKTICDGLRIRGELELHEMDIPKELTENGEVRIQFVTDSGPPAMAGMCDFWIMEKENVPWTSS